MRSESKNKKRRKNEERNLVKAVKMDQKQNQRDIYQMKMLRMAKRKEEEDMMNTRNHHPLTAMISLTQSITKRVLVVHL